MPKLQLISCRGCGRRLLVKRDNGETRAFLVFVNRKKRISGLTLLLSTNKLLPENVCPHPRCQSPRIFSWRNSKSVKKAAKILQMKGEE